jgi:uncharacterized protein (TIGR03435 family)
MRTLTAVLLSATGLATAQTAAVPRFEVASVKPAATDERGSEISTAPNGRLTITNLTLRDMILYAWGIKPFQLSGARGWIESGRYDVVAKPETKPKDNEIKAMLRSLLAERFGLVVHKETTELPIYALVVAKPGKLGPGLVEFKDGSCPEFDPAKPPPPPTPGKPPVLPCGRIRSGRTGIIGAGIRLADLIDRIAPLLGRTVVDETGLTGKYDINLQWPPPPVASSPDAPTPARSEDGSPVFNSMREQLGLKLEPNKGPVEILVIDKVAKPTEN